MICENTDRRHILYSQQQFSFLSSSVWVPVPQTELLQSGDWLAAHRSREDSSQGPEDAHAAQCVHPQGASPSLGQWSPCPVTSDHLWAPGGRLWSSPFYWWSNWGIRGWDNMPRNTASKRQMQKEASPQTLRFPFCPCVEPLLCPFSSWKRTRSEENA